MTADRSTAQLVKALEAHPQIMALARNPLLLTMIAFLYTDKRYPLPHSRAEFYQKSTDLLLRQLHEERNRNIFHPTDKYAVLEDLALYINDTENRDQRDSRGLSYSAIIERVRALQPQLTIDPKQEASALIKEIEERSGILISEDGGNSYQFAHRSLQEFFAAEKLKANFDELYKHFLIDPEAWHEPVKLWCGLPRNDSTELIQRIFKEYPLIALECLADAELVSQEVSDRIINSFKARLHEADADDHLARAFGLVASSPRPRGKDLFSFLEIELANADNLMSRGAAAKSLSYTDLPQAASLLAKYYMAWDGVRAPLVRMGDLAVTDLAALINLNLTDNDYVTYYQRDIKEATPEELEDATYLDDVRDLILVKSYQAPAVMDDLQAIGTPQAAEIFVNMLWSTNKILAGGASWRLASLLSQPDVEDSLQNYNLTEQQLKAERLEWIWQPFTKHARTALPIIAGRISYLIENAPFGTAPLQPLRIDPRLAIPLCTVKAEQELNIENLEGKPTMELAAVLSALLERSDEPHSDEKNINLDSHAVRKALTKAIAKLIRGTGDAYLRELQMRLIKAICTATKASQRCQYLLLGIQNNLQLDFLLRLVNGPIPRREDWANISRPVKYKFESSWHYFLMLFILIIVSFSAFSQITLTLLQMPLFPIWGNAILHAF